MMRSLSLPALTPNVRRPVYVQLHTASSVDEEEEGLHGVFTEHSRGGYATTDTCQWSGRRRRGVTWCVQAATPQRTPACRVRRL
jgi:hypothetical protein